MKDPKVYPDPDRFLPERYLASDGNETQKDPREYAFGFGRRFVLVPKLHHSRETYTRLMHVSLQSLSRYGFFIDCL